MCLSLKNENTIYQHTDHPQMAVVHGSCFIPRQMFFFPDVSQFMGGKMPSKYGWSIFASVTLIPIGFMTGFPTTYQYTIYNPNIMWVRRGKTTANHPPVITIFLGGINHTINRWYKNHSQMGSLWHGFTHIKSEFSWDWFKGETGNHGFYPKISGFTVKFPLNQSNQIPHFQWTFPWVAPSRSHRSDPAMQMQRSAGSGSCFPCTLRRLRPRKNHHSPIFGDIFNCIPIKSQKSPYVLKTVLLNSIKTCFGRA